MEKKNSVTKPASPIVHVPIFSTTRRGKVTVVDARNPDFSMDPGTKRSEDRGKRFPSKNPCGTGRRPNKTKVTGFEREESMTEGEKSRCATREGRFDNHVLLGGGRGQKKGVVGGKGLRT